MSQLWSIREDGFKQRCDGAAQIIIPAPLNIRLGATFKMLFYGFTRSEAGILSVWDWSSMTARGQIRVGKDNGDTLLAEFDYTSFPFTPPQSSDDVADRLSDLTPGFDIATNCYAGRASIPASEITSAQTDIENNNYRGYFTWEITDGTDVYRISEGRVLFSGEAAQAAGSVSTPSGTFFIVQAPDAASVRNIFGPHYFPGDTTVTSVRIAALDAPIGQDLKVAIKKNGSTSATATLTAGTTSELTNISDISFTSSDYLSMSITQIGTDLDHPGSDLVVTLYYE